MSYGIDYGDIEIEANQIRLLAIPVQSGGNATQAANQPLVCELSVYNRGESPPYYALSYAWGCCSISAPIIVNGREYLIGETVAEALWHVGAQHDSHTTMYVWVDQICINQNNSPEKGLQVQKMWEIYSEAEHVLAWICPTFVNSDLLFEHLRNMSSAVEKDDEAEFLKLHENKEHNSKIQEAFATLCKQPYWTRLWVMQEYAAGKDIKIVCGNASIDGKVFGVAMDRIFRLGGPKFAELLPIFSPVERSFVANLVTRRARFRYNLDNKRDDADDDPFFQVLVTSLALYDDYNHPQTSDPRDRIFSLLNLAPDSNDFSGTLDYSKTCEDVYLETAQVILGQGGIDLLSFCQFPKTFSSLPTWVPDWNMQIRHPSVEPPWRNKFDASGDTHDKQSLSYPRPGHLKLHGVAVDTVKDFGSIWDPSWSEPIDLAAASKFVAEILELCKRSPRIKLHEEEVEAARISNADAVEWALSDPPTPFAQHLQDFFEAYPRFKAYREPEAADEDGMNEKEAPKTMDPNTDWFLRGLYRLHSRRPFITSTGFIGIGPEHLAIGDEICIFYGGKTPYMVRQSGHGCWALVGEVYVHGIMHGEFLKGDVPNKVYVLA